MAVTLNNENFGFLWEELNKIFNHSLKSYKKNLKCTLIKVTYYVHT